MSPAKNRHFGCRIMDDLSYKGLRTLFLENELLRVGILLDKGADVFQFLHKPTDTDFLWRSPQGLIPPTQARVTRESAAGAFLDTYHGGWQEVFPGGGPADYRGAELGLHGEVTHLGWQAEITADDPDQVAVRLSVDCLRTPFRLEKTFRLESGTPTLFIDECLTNLSPETLEFMWGHHPAIGAPFLKEGTRLFIPSRTVQVHSPKFISSGRLEPGSEFAWPHAPYMNGSFDLSCLPGPDGGFGELLYLKDLEGGWYAVIDPEKQVGFCLTWPVDIFPYVWFWQVYGRAPGYPWWDRAYVIALEPWTSIPNSLTTAINQGSARTIKGGEQIKVSLTAGVISGVETVTWIDPDGTVH